jgi:hypothetical protein
MPCIGDRDSHHSDWTREELPQAGVRAVCRKCDSRKPTQGFTWTGPTCLNQYPSHLFHCRASITNSVRHSESPRGRVALTVRPSVLLCCAYVRLFLRMRLPFRRRRLTQIGQVTLRLPSKKQLHSGLVLPSIEFESPFRIRVWILYLKRHVVSAGGMVRAGNSCNGRRLIRTQSAW